MNMTKWIILLVLFVSVDASGNGSPPPDRKIGRGTGEGHQLSDKQRRIQEQRTQNQKNAKEAREAAEHDALAAKFRGTSSAKSSSQSNADATHAAEAARSTKYYIFFPADQHFSENVKLQDHFHKNLIPDLKKEIVSKAKSVAEFLLSDDVGDTSADWRQLIDGVTEPLPSDIPIKDLKKAKKMPSFNVYDSTKKNLDVQDEKDTRNRQGSLSAFAFMSNVMDGRAVDYDSNPRLFVFPTKKKIVDPSKVRDMEKADQENLFKKGNLIVIHFDPAEVLEACGGTKGAGLEEQLQKMEQDVLALVGDL